MSASLAQNEQTRAGAALAERIELARLIDLASQRLSIAVEYDPTLLASSTSLHVPSIVPDEELWPLANRLLATRGLTTVLVPGSGVFSVVRISDAAASARVSRELATSPAPGFQSVLVTPLYRSTADAAALVRPILSRPGGSVTELAGMLLISDLSPRVEEAMAFLRQVDEPASAASFVEVRVLQAAPDAIIDLARSIAEGRAEATGQRVGGSLVASPDARGVLIVGSPDQIRYWRGLVQALDRPEAPEWRSYPTPVGGRASVERDLHAWTGDGAGCRVEGDDHILRVLAPPSLHRRLHAHFDQAMRAEAGDVMRVLPIRNRRVTDVAERLQHLVASGALAGPGRLGAAETMTAPDGEGRSDLAATEPPRSSPGPVARGSRIIADESANVLVVVGKPSTLDQIEAILPSIDVRQVQVMLEVMLISLSETDSTALGIELERIGEIGGSTYRLASLFGLSTAGAAGRVVGDAAGLTGAVLDPGEFSVIVRALQSVANGRSLSMPRVLVANNEQATFSSVVQQPILETVRGDTDTTTSFGGTQDAGTTISVKPQVTAGEHLLLTYQVSLSSFVGSASAAGLPPPRQQNRVDSTAIVPDAHTVVVGGLDLTTTSSDAAQVPWIAKLPLVGEAFKNQSTSAARSRFYVLIRATVLRHATFDDLKHLSQATAESLGLDEGFPTSAPRVIR